MRTDQLLRGLLPASDLRVVVVHAGEAARHAARIHGAAPTAAVAMAEALAGAALLAGLGKDRQRVTVQLEGDGPMRGLFADASADGSVRAWVRGASIDFPGRDPEDLRFALGPHAWLAVLRELDNGEFYRGTIALDPPRLDAALVRYFETSEQIPTRLVVEVRRDAAGGIAQATGLLVQRLPGGDDEALAALGERLVRGSLSRALAADGAVPAIAGLEDLEILERTPLAYRCTCDRDRALRGVLAAGTAGVEELIGEGGATLTCEFCKSVYRFSPEELRAALSAAAEP